VGALEREETRSMNSHSTKGKAQEITKIVSARIFTGKMPKDTGILGNEFFARDLIFAASPDDITQRFNVPHQRRNPPGIISFGSGAFPGYDTFRPGKIDDDFFVPLQLNWYDIIDRSKTPQNGPLLRAETIYEQLNQIEGLKKPF